MATSKSYFPRHNYHFLTVDHNLHHHHDSSFEFDESDIYESPEFRKQVRINNKATAAPRLGDRTTRSGAPSSLPINVPDWSKILKDEYRENRRRVIDEEELGGGEYLEGERVPPHELLAKAKIASFSVHEGVGRTLKGRDLSRVRNAIWEKTGFQD
ncbi:hypothetical protein LINGRAHAP2_LOCUS19907 [Linum grandiflorum]